MCYLINSNFKFFVFIRTEPRDEFPPPQNEEMDAKQKITAFLWRKKNVENNQF